MLHMKYVKIWKWGNKMTIDKEIKQHMENLVKMEEFLEDNMEEHPEFENMNKKEAIDYIIKQGFKKEYAELHFEEFEEKDEFRLVEKENEFGIFWKNELIFEETNQK